MKLKTRIKSFYRHNKMCIGMWCCFLELLFVALPPYDISNTLTEVMLAFMWLIVWQRDRREDTLIRKGQIMECYYRRTLIKMAKQLKSYENEYRRKD